ncbi:MAG TPA: hypothetical protein VEY12_07860, partial [Thermoplasmata archaeon]|nr:hypothetical protein [Thermoplasmata archaeon]
MVQAFAEPAACGVLARGGAVEVLGRAVGAGEPRPARSVAATIATVTARTIIGVLLARDWANALA